MYNPVLIGADIEVFLFNKKTNMFHSVEGLLGGTKEHPLKLEKPGCAIQEDNLAAEFNVNPSLSPDDMWEDIVYNLNYITNNLPDDLIVKIAASANFPIEQVYTEQGQKFGCEPDFNAYTLMENPAVTDAGTLRSAGGHIHFGLEASEEDRIRFIKLLDFYLGIPSIVLDKDKERRRLYGQAGCYRLKSYGIEYRTLSNFWIQEKNRVRWLFNNIELALEAWRNPSVSARIIENQNQTIDIINRQMDSLAWKVCEKNSLLYNRKNRQKVRE